MNQLNVYYRALLKYREHTLKDRDCISDRSAITKVNTESDKIVLERNICTVDTDWIEAIEVGLEFIDKAIKEERQFIRSNGEVIPIEKVKNVSKASVEHLARHSNLITREVEGEDLIPDQLYTVEKLNDYAVYENRFLYMLLCYLRDFITLRYNKILELSNTYKGSMTMDKTVKLPKQTLEYKVSLREERREDKYLRKNNKSKDIIDRIDLILKAVLAFIACPLMKLVAKAPMLKPPITRTNVLKMNNNFKQAMALYSFIVAYDKPGYTVEKQITELNPFRDDLADEMAESVLMASFLTYEYGLGIKNILKQEYEEEEKKRKEAEYQRFLEKLDTVRRRVAASGETPEEYIMMLEKHIRILEGRCADLVETQKELSETKKALLEEKERNEALTKELEDVTLALENLRIEYAEEVQRLLREHDEAVRLLKESHEQEINDISSRHKEEIDTINAEHKEEVDTLNAQHNAYVEELNTAHENEVNSLNQNYSIYITTLKDAHEKDIASLNEAHKTEKETYISNCNAEITRLTDIIEQQRVQNENERNAYVHNMTEMQKAQERERIAYTAERQKLLSEIEQLTSEKRLANANIYLLKDQKGDGSQDFTSAMSFNELEHTFNAFKEFYKKQWKLTKKSIRNELLKSKDNKETEEDRGTEEQ